MNFMFNSKPLLITYASKIIYALSIYEILYSLILSYIAKRN